MIVLKADLSASPKWHTVTTADGDFRVQITPPTYEQWILDQGRTSLSATLLGRLECVTGWNGVVTPLDNGGTVELPFSREMLGVMLRSNPNVFDQIGAIIKPLFDGPSDQEKANAEKNSVRPSTETEPTMASLNS